MKKININKYVVELREKVEGVNLIVAEIESEYLSESKEWYEDIKEKIKVGEFDITHSSLIDINGTDIPIIEKIYKK